MSYSELYCFLSNYYVFQNNIRVSYLIFYNSRFRFKMYCLCGRIFMLIISLLFKHLQKPQGSLAW